MNAPSIGRTTQTTPSADEISSTPAQGPATTGAKPQPDAQAGAVLNALSALHGGGASSSAVGGGAAAGKGRQAAFAMKPKADDGANMAGQSGPVQGRTAASHASASSLEEAVEPTPQSAPASSAFVASQPSASGSSGRLGSALEAAAPLIGDGANVLGAGVQIASGVMQAIQSAEMAIAETLKNGAHNVEEASKGA